MSARAGLAVDSEDHTPSSNARGRRPRGKLWRNPKQGREWTPAPKRAIPPKITKAQLTERLYAEGGPKYGKRERPDAIDTLWRVYCYLHVRCAREDSGRFACSFFELIAGLVFELSGRSAKAWKSNLGRGMQGARKREALLTRKRSAVCKALDELAQCGLLVWGGERDQAGFWWRTELQLLEPEGPPPPPEPWMRSTRPPFKQTDDAWDRDTAHGDPAAQEAADAALKGCLEAIEAVLGTSAGLGARVERLLGEAAVRFETHAAHRPAGVPATAAKVIEAQLRAFVDDDADYPGPRKLSPLARVVPLFIATANRGETAAKKAATAPTPDPASNNCAALLNQPTALTSNRASTSALAARTSAGAGNRCDGHAASATGPEGPVKAPTKRAASGGGSDREVWDEVVVARVRARERRLEAARVAGGAWREPTVQRARSWPSDRPLPVGLLTDAVGALTGQRPWLDPSQIDRWRRVEQRYVEHFDQRPAGAPETPAAAVLELVEHAGPQIRHRLPWAISQLDMLTKRMRRQARAVIGGGGRVQADALARQRRRAWHRQRRHERDLREQQAADRRLRALGWRLGRRRDPGRDQAHEKAAGLAELVGHALTIGAMPAHPAAVRQALRRFYPEPADDLRGHPLVFPLVDPERLHQLVADQILADPDARPATLTTVDRASYAAPVAGTWTPAAGVLDPGDRRADTTGAFSGDFQKSESEPAGQRASFVVRGVEGRRAFGHLARPGRGPVNPWRGAPRCAR